MPMGEGLGAGLGRSPVRKTERRSLPTGIGDIRYFESDPGSQWKRCDGKPLAFTGDLANVLSLARPGTFAVATNVGTSYGIRDIAYGNGKWVGVSGDGFSWTSHDGLTWSRGVQINTSGGGAVRLEFGNGIFVAALAQNGTGVFTSSDGVTWTLRTIAFGAAPTQLDFVNDRFVASAGGFSLFESFDGVNWTARTAPPSQLNQITFGKGLYVGVGNSQKIATSPDLITWTDRPHGLTSFGNFPGVAFGNGVFALAETNNRGFFISYDGITWEISGYTHPGAVGWTKIKYLNGLWFCGAEASNVEPATSLDGRNWLRDPNFASAYGMVAAQDGAGKIVCAGGNPGATGAAFRVASSRLATPATPSPLGRPDLIPFMKVA